MRLTLSLTCSIILPLSVAIFAIWMSSLSVTHPGIPAPGEPTPEPKALAQFLPAAFR